MCRLPLGWVPVVSPLVFIKLYYKSMYTMKDPGTYALYVPITGSPDMSVCHMFHSKALAAPFYEKDKTLVADWSHQLPL